MTNTEIYNSIAYLKNAGNLRKNKYRRNLRKYLASPSIELDSNNFAVGWSYLYSDNTLPPSNLNVIKSIIDTLTSKIAQSKVRPYFNTMNGDYNDKQSAIQTQQYFDIVFENYGVHKIVSEAFRDSCIFDTGIIFIDTDDVKRANPWGVYFDPNETNNNIPYTKIVYERNNYPVSALPKSVKEKVKNKSIIYCSYSLYFDTVNHIKAYLVNDKVLLTEKYNLDIVPFVILPYQRLIGNTSLSIVDTLYSLQTEIDLIEQKIGEASQLTPANTMFVPEGSNIKANQINNGIGNIMTYRPSPAGGDPVSISTPNFIAQQYIDARNDYIQKAYELTGISLLSATGQKPSGVDSGIALSTLENVESDRFETQVKQVINSYVEITKLIIKLKEDNENILPESNNIYNVKWADIKKSVDNMKIQFSAADSLSKDPSVKLQQLQVLAQQGIIPKNRVAQLMELPDIQSGYNLSNNAINAVYTVIDDCINHDNFNIPSYIPFVMLKEEIINTQLSLKASNKQDNLEDIKKLQRLYEEVENLEEKYGAIDNPNQQVLEQEANQKPISPGSMRTEDLDASTDNNENGSWGTQYSLKSMPE